MNYISDIRKHIGHDLVMTVGCGVLIVNDQDQVLLQRRSDTGDWCIPGGALEPYETYEEAATREVREELFPADSRAILDWKKGVSEVVVH